MRLHLIRRLWRGEERLWIAYWLFGVLGGWVVATIVSNLVVFNLAPPLIGAVLMILYACFTAVAIWRCAFRVNWRPFAYAARAIVIISAAALIYEFGKGFYVN